MNKRLFTFGCSFTRYAWPTWADIASTQFDSTENWAQVGGGNAFIFYSLCEAIKRNNITADDTVAIMWTSISREDRWLTTKGWITPGSIYNQNIYHQDWVQQFADPTGYLIRDLAFISAARMMLNNIGCAWHFFSIVPFAYHNDSDTDPDCFFDTDQEVMYLYREDIEHISPSVYELVFNNDWYSRPGQVRKDFLRNRYENCAGVDWPQWDDFLVNGTKNCSRTIRKEIQQQFKFERELIRTDTHPTPSEHLEYLEKVWPDLVIPNTVRLWVEETNQAVLNNNPLGNLWTEKFPKRF